MKYLKQIRNFFILALGGLTPEHYKKLTVINCELGAKVMEEAKTIAYLHNLLNQRKAEVKISNSVVADFDKEIALLKENVSTLYSALEPLKRDNWDKYMTICGLTEQIECLEEEAASDEFHILMFYQMLKAVEKQ